MARLERRWAWLDSRTLADLVRAGFELGMVRLQLKSYRAKVLVAAPLIRPRELDDRQEALIGRVAFAIPRVAARLPWRADCLVQALAAKRWLTRHDIVSTLTFGVPRDKPAAFEAHAWLSAGDIIVTGGDISGYVPLARP